MHSVHDLIARLDEAGKLPFACDERERIYKAVQSTQVFLSPVKKVKHVDSSDDNENDSDVDNEAVCMSSLLNGFMIFEDFFHLCHATKRLPVLDIIWKFTYQTPVCLLNFCQLLLFH